MMDLQSVLAIAAATTAAVQAEELEHELHEFELDQPPKVQGAPWATQGADALGDEPLNEH
jgi:hypothetical protein